MGLSMVKAAEKKAGKQPVRLYVKGVVTSFKRSGTATQYENQNIMKIQGVQDRASTAFYLGKKVAYVYKAQTAKKGSKYRCIWGVIRRAHGNNGAVRAAFRKNLPPKALGAPVRVMLYPSKI